MFLQRRGRRARLGLLPFLIILLIPLSLGAAFFGWRWLNTSLPQIQGEAKVMGISQPVTIARDAAGIPTIRAESEADAYFALGYVHAQDRLWQMDLQRRIASGRLAEIAGRAGLSNDRFFRTLGLQGRVESAYEALNEPTRQMLAAYTAGINALIASFDGWRQPPPEFLLAGVRPKPWRPSDTLLWHRVIALQMAGNWRDELLNLKLAQRLGGKRAADLTGLVLPDPRQTAMPDLTSLLAEIPGDAAQRMASNVWAVAPNRSTTEGPLLANDPHLNFQAPVLWYLARIEAPQFAVQGATLPGSPFVVVGQNRTLAWGLTSAHADSMDLFVETLDEGNPGRYLTPEGPAPFLVRQETIEIKGEADLRIEVRETRHGPVLSDALSAKELPRGVLLSLASTALNPADKTPEAFHAMSHANDAAEFRQALASFNTPSQYVAYAAWDGRIGLSQTGLIPIRAGTASPDLPRPGADGSSDWTGFVKASDMPGTSDPQSGVALNANERLADEGYPFHLSSSRPDSLRAKRIEQLLAAKERHGPDDMTAYQMDSLSMAFRVLKDRILSIVPEHPQAKHALSLLKDWDGSMARDLIEPTIFAAWAEEMQRALFSDELRRLPSEAEDQPSLFDAWSQSLKPTILEAALRESDWCDDESTSDKKESCDDILVRSLAESLRRLKRELGNDMSRWRWGSVHRAKFPHGLLERLPVPESWVAPSIETDGDGSSLNRGSFAFGNFKHFHGAGLRAVFDVRNPARSRFIVASGQSGNPLSSHYDDELEAWREGRYLMIDGGTNKPFELVLWPLQGGQNGR